MLTDPEAGEAPSVAATGHGQASPQGVVYGLAGLQQAQV
jgi:hypothetical protein